jgi:riboflavin biosynthesis pyrimidine reductase
MTRPYVICHMVPSVDGRIVTDGWPVTPGLVGEYERTAATFGADGWIIGRISMEPYAGAARLPARRRAERIPRADFVARTNAPGYAIAIDPHGRLRWESGAVDEEHAIAVLTEGVTDRYLAFLRASLDRRRRGRDPRFCTVDLDWVEAEAWNLNLVPVARRREVGQGSKMEADPLVGKASAVADG